MDNLQTIFESHYQKWKSFTATGAITFSSLSEDYINNPYFEAIVQMGQPVVPLIIRKFRSDPSSHFLIYALERITKHQFTSNEISGEAGGQNGIIGNQGFAELWRRWWNQQHPEETI